MKYLMLLKNMNAKQTKAKEEKQTKANWFVRNPFLASLLGVSFLWLSTPIVLSLIKYCRGYDLAKLGQIGDMYGTINSLFSGLTVAGLIYTIISQQKEISDTKKQVRIQSYQRFENTFFHLIKLHQTKHEVSANSEREWISPLSDYASRLVSEVSYIDDYDRITQLFRSKHENFIKSTFGQYIMNYQNTIDFIYLHKNKKSSQSKYIKTYLLQLQTHELQFIFLFYTLKNDQPPNNFKDYINIIYTLISYNPKVQTNKGILSIASRWGAITQYNEFV